MNDEVGVSAGGSDEGQSTGVEVERTGLALVRQGERILPEAGSEAKLRSAPERPASSVEVVVPVEIEVRAAPSQQDLEGLVDLVLRRLGRGLLAT